MNLLVSLKQVHEVGLNAVKNSLKEKEGVVSSQKDRIGQLVKKKEELGQIIVEKKKGIQNLQIENQKVQKDFTALENMIPSKIVQATDPLDQQIKALQKNLQEHLQEALSMISLLQNLE